MTESSYTSGSTATPPKLLGTELELEQSDYNDFGNMFDSFGKDEIKLLEEPGALGPTIIENPVGHERRTYINCPADNSPGGIVICKV